jgi:hypothetical protein
MLHKLKAGSREKKQKIFFWSEAKTDTSLYYLDHGKSICLKSEKNG